MIARHRLSVGLALVGGLGFGWLIGAGRPPRLRADGAGRPGDRLVISGPIGYELGGPQKVPIPKEAIYYLNYDNGYLLAAIPNYSAVGSRTQVLSEFAERDLVKDFGIAPQARAHFVMAAGSLGATGDGGAPLHVFETVSGQVATYRLVPQTTAGSSRPLFQLLERRSDPRLGGR